MPMPMPMPRGHHPKTGYHERPTKAAQHLSAHKRGSDSDDGAGADRAAIVCVLLIQISTNTLITGLSSLVTVQHCCPAIAVAVAVVMSDWRARCFCSLSVS